ncbi:MAG: hypothetical protein WKF84_30505 [Pyrinomonadaceae bacterium]
MQVHLPVKMHIYGSGETLGDIRIMPVVNGFTRDVSEIGLASFFRWLASTMKILQTNIAG